jgi:hypothetical protein
MGDMMEAADVTNTETAVMAYPVETAMEAVSVTSVSATMTAVSATVTAVSAAMTTASDCDGRRESCDRDGKDDGRFSKHRSVSSVGHSPRRDASAGG